METIKEEKKAEWIKYEMLDFWDLVRCCKMYSELIEHQTKIIVKLTNDNQEITRKLDKYLWQEIPGNPSGNPSAIKRGKSS